MDPQHRDDDAGEEYDTLPMADLSPKPHKPRSRVKPLVVVGVVVLVIAVVAFLVFGRHKAATPATSKSATANTAKVTTKISSTTKHYNSSNLFLGFDYPDDWTVSDADILTVTSPVLTLKSGSGQAENAKIVMKIQNPPTAISEFAGNTAVAALASQKLTYKQPTPNQRAQTYLTFVSYAGKTSVIDALYITGDNGYTAAQYVPESDIVKANPLINISFYGCSDAACAKPSAMSIASSAWSDAGLSRPLVAMLESLALE